MKLRWTTLPTELEPTKPQQNPPDGPWSLADPRSPAVLCIPVQRASPTEFTGGNFERDTDSRSKQNCNERSLGKRVALLRVNMVRVVGSVGPCHSSRRHVYSYPCTHTVPNFQHDCTACRSIVTGAFCWAKKLGPRAFSVACYFCH